MTLDATRIYRCGECDATRDWFGVHWNRNVGTTTDRCPHCHELSPGVVPSLRLTVRKGVHRDNTPPERDPDYQHNGVELYVTGTRGEAAAEVERREAGPAIGDEYYGDSDDDEK